MAVLLLKLTLCFLYAERRDFRSTALRREEVLLWDGKCWAGSYRDRVSHSTGAAAVQGGRVDEFTSLGALEGPGPQSDVPQAKSMTRRPEHPEKVLLKGLHWTFFQSLLGPSLLCMAHGTHMSTSYEPHISLHVPFCGTMSHLLCLILLSQHQAQGLAPGHCY